MGLQVKVKFGVSFVLINIWKLCLKSDQYFLLLNLPYESRFFSAGESGEGVVLKEW